jgi:2,5-furandicarboxylate decarboxylase 1
MVDVTNEHRPGSAVPRSRDLRSFLASNADVLTIVKKPVRIDDIGALSAQSEQPILFENIVEFPNRRLCDILVKHRHLQARALGVPVEDYLKTLAYRLRKPPRGFVRVDRGPVKEVKLTGDRVDWLKELPAPIHAEHESLPYISAMNIVRDPETGFYNSSHAGTNPLGPTHGVMSFATPHTHLIMNKYRRMGFKEMPIAIVCGVHPAYEIMANFSGLHMDMWGELEMAGTILDQDLEMVPCETIDLEVPAHAEIVVEGLVNLGESVDAGQVVAPTSYYLPRRQSVQEVKVTAITMRADRPIYRNHQTCPFTDHQVLPRLCHEAMLYNRIAEIGIDVKDVRFPVWGGALSCIIQVEASRPGFINDALMACMGAPWLNTKVVVAISHDTNIEDPGEVYHAIATRCDPAKDIFVVPGTRGSLYDPSAEPLADHFPFRVVGKMGIDATAKTRYGKNEFEPARPKNWGKVRLSDYL